MLPAAATGERGPGDALPENADAHTAADYTLSPRTQALIADGVPANTRRAYTRQWAAFTAWCARNGRIALPATAHTLAEYASGLCAADQAPASIEQAIAAVRTMHRLAGHTGQPATESARLALRAYKRRRAEAGGRGQREAPPITIDALRAMVSACDLGTPAGRRDRLLLVLGLALMGRRSELVALTREDVREVADGLEVTTERPAEIVLTGGLAAHAPQHSH
ncbi:site-specific integrase, partial [Nonomuraea fuscirosea]